MTDQPLMAVPMISTALVAILASSLLLAAGYRLFRRGIADADPATRSFAVLCYGLMAPATGVIVAAFSLHPGITHFLVPEHCHGGVCGSHVPAVDPFSFGGIGLAAAGSAGLFLLAIVTTRAVLAAKRRLMMLFSLARHESARGYHLLETDDIVAWCCGLLRPRIVVSRGLVSALSPKQLEVVLAHEAAHAARFDNLRALLLRWATACWPVARHQVWRDMREDGERACDAAALARTGSREVFAGTLLALGCGKDTVTPSRRATFGHGDVGRRLAALPVGGSGSTGIRTAWLALGSTWLIQVALVTAVSHFVVEWVGF